MSPDHYSRPAGSGANYTLDYEEPQIPAHDTKNRETTTESQLRSYYQ